MDTSVYRLEDDTFGIFTKLDVNETPSAADGHVDAAGSYSPYLFQQFTAPGMIAACTVSHKRYRRRTVRGRGK